MSARTRATLPLFWGVADALRRDPQGWELSHARFELRRSIEISGMRWVMSARLGSSIGPLESGSGPRGRLLSLPYVHLWGPRITRAERRRLARGGAYDRVAGVFKEHGYTLGWGEELGRKLLWAHPWPHAPGVGPLSDQRRWLEQVFVADGRQRPHRAAGLSKESLWSVLDSFRDDRAGPWLPVVFEFNTTRSLVLRGSAVGAPRLVVRVERWDMGGPVARCRALARVDVEFFMRGRAEDRHRLRRRGWFAAAAARLHREGFRGEWFRYRNVQPLGRFSHSRLTSASQVLRERSHLGGIVDELLSVE